MSMSARVRGPALRVGVAAVLVGSLLGCAGRSASAGSAGTSDPSSASTGSTASPTPTGTVVRLDVIHQGKATLVLAPVTIDGKGPYPFILDTGAATSAINKKLADQLGLEPTGKQADVSGVTGRQVVDLVSLRSWSLGDTTLKAGAIGAVQFPDKGGTSSHIAGLLGSDRLSRFGSVEIDYRRQQLRFTP